jgi:hypothetical protein
MIIGTRQMEAFRAAARQGFEAELLGHIKQQFPRAVEGIEDARLRQAVSAGVERAGRHGFRARGPVRMFVGYQVLLGHEFDQDPALFWIGDILRDREGLDEMTQAKRVHLHVSTYLDLVYGPDGEHVSEGLEHIATAKLQELTAVGRALGSAAIPYLQALHARKCVYAGGEALCNLIGMAQQASGESGLPAIEGPPMVLVLFLMLGAGVLTDPLFPWVAESLKGGTSQERLERLFGRTQAHVRQALEQYARV